MRETVHVFPVCSGDAITRRPRRNSLPRFGERYAHPLTGPTQVGGRKVSQLANEEIGTCLIRFRFRSRALDPWRGKLRPERVSAWRERVSKRPTMEIGRAH